MATRNISTKLAIQGESEYRASLSRVNSELKTLTSALKLTESQFRTNANSMAALRAKGEALNNLYQAQKSKVSELRAALDNAKRAEETYSAQKAELTAKIRANSEALEKLKRSAGDTSAEEKKLTDENKELSAQLQTCDANLDATTKGVNAWQTQLNNAEAKLNDLDAEIQENNKYLKEAEKSADETAQSIDEFGNKTKESGEAVGALAAALTAAGLMRGFKELVSALNECSKAAAGFEYGMATVAAISGASDTELQKLSDRAKEYAASSVFMASDVAQAYEYMGMAGWSAQQMLDGLNGIMALSSASGEDLGMVCDIVTDALTAFGLAAKDSAHFSDVLAKASSSSNTNVSMMGQSFTMVASTAGTLGYSIDDVAVALGAMANQGLKGEMAGTALATALTRMSGTNDNATKAMKRLGLEMYDEAGAAKELGVFLNELRASFDGLSEKEKQQQAYYLAGMKGMKGLMTIVNTSTTDWNNLTLAIAGANGAADEMSKIKLDTYEGQVALLQSAMEALQISVGEKLNPALGDLAETGADVLSWASDFVKKHEEVVPVIGGVTTALGVLTVAVTGFTITTQFVIPVVKSFNAALASNPIGLVAVAIGTLVTALGTMIALSDSAIPSVKELTSAARDMQDTMKDSGDALADSLESTQAAANLAERYISKLEELEATGLKTNEQQREYHNTLQLLCQLVPDLVQYIDLETDSIEGGTAALRENTEAWRKNAEQQAYQERLTELVQAHADVLLEQEKNSIRLTEATEKLKVAQEEENDAQERMQTLWDEAQAKADSYYEQTGALTEATDWLSSEYYDLADALRRLNEETSDAETTVQVHKQAINDDAEAVQEAESEISLMQQAIENLTGAQMENTEATEENTQTQYRSVEAIDGIIEDLEDLAEQYRDAYDAALDSINGQMGLFNEFTGEMSEDVDTIEEMMKRWAEQTEALAEYTENLKKAGQLGIDDGLIQSLSDGSASSAAYLAQIIKEFEDAGVTVSEDMPESARKFRDEFNAAFEGTMDARASFAETVRSLDSSFNEALSGLEARAKAISFDGFWDAVSEQFGDAGTTFKTIGKEIGDGLEEGIEDSEDDVADAAESVSESLTNAAKDKLGVHSRSAVFYEIGQNVDLGLKEGIEDKEPSVVGAVDDMGSEMTTKMQSGAKKSVEAFDREFAKIVRRTEQQIQSLKRALTSGMSDIPASMGTIGEQTVDGMISGMNRRSGALYSAISSIVNNAIVRAQAAAAVESPSKKTTAIFEYVGDGMILGIENRRKALEDKMQSVVDTALDVEVKNSIAARTMDIKDQSLAVTQAVATAARPQETVVPGNNVSYEFNIEINGAEVKDPNELADIVEERIQTKLARKEAVWR